MSETLEQQPAEAGQGKPKIDLSLVRVVDVSCGILYQAFFRQTRNRIKALFKDIKKGKTVALGKLNLERKNNDTGEVIEQLDIRLNMKLNRDEYRGAINFPAFETVLGAMLSRISEHLKDKKDLNILTDEKGTALVHVPGVIQVDGQFNVLVMAFEPQKDNSMLMHLMFVDPDQYEALKK